MARHKRTAVQEPELIISHIDRQKVRKKGRLGGNGLSQKISGNVASYLRLLLLAEESFSDWYHTSSAAFNLHQ